MQDSTTVGSPETLLQQSIKTAAEDPVLILPSHRLVRSFVRLGLENETERMPDSIRLLAPEATLKAVRNEFTTAARLADLVDGELVEFRAVDDDSPAHPLVVSESGYSALLSGADDQFCGIGGEEPVAIDHFRAYAADLWERGREFPLRTPGYNTLLTALDEDMGSDIRNDVEAALEASDSPTIGDQLDAVELLILIAARNRRQLYHISRVGEDTALLKMQYGRRIIVSWRVS